MGFSHQMRAGKGGVSHLCSVYSLTTVHNAATYKLLIYLRMKRLCNQYIEEFDEENIYQQYLKKGDNLFNFLCQSSAHPFLTDVCIKDNQTKVKTEL